MISGSWIMTLVSLLIFAILFGLAVNGYLIYNEKYQYRTAWPYPSTHSDMVSIAKKKKDHDMTDDEFNTKYAPFRHEAFRFALFSKALVHRLNGIFHFIELWLLYGGPDRLHQRHPIKEPIFIIGDFRSGTSVLERLIAHHPDITFFTMSHQVLWSGPYLWSLFLEWMGFIRENVLGHKSWNRPGNKGIYYPHSSNVLLHRGRPFEIENLWDFCRQNLNTKRNNIWAILDDSDLNPDNNADRDILDDTFQDPEFETLLVNSIGLLLAKHSKSGQCRGSHPRFIWKNPLNGYRLGFLHRVFPDAKFIHIARNPLKTTLSQIQMAHSNLRCFFMNEMECREHDHKPPPKEDTKQCWNAVFNGKYPNEILGTLWFPRQFPRTVPEYQKITTFLKRDQYECAVATAVTQQERVVMEGFKKIGAKEGENVLTIWHEDVLDDASGTFEKVMAYLGLECTEKERLYWLEEEDFPGGQANRSRVKQSNQTEKKIDFGKWTKEVTEIIEQNEVMKRYQNRKKRVIGNGCTANPTDE